MKCKQNTNYLIQQQKLPIVLKLLLSKMNKDTLKLQHLL